jgi:hypothetical protein
LEKYVDYSYYPGAYKANYLFKVEHHICNVYEIDKNYKRDKANEFIILSD